MLIFGVTGTATLLAGREGWTQMYWRVSERGWGWFLLSIVFAIFIHDAYFYWTHRAMHHPRLFKLFHRVHHLSMNPSPWASYSFAPLEAVVQASIFPLVTLLVPIHPLAFGLFTWLYRVADYDAAAARNLTLLFMVSYSNLHVLNCRSETRSILRIPLTSNPVLVTGVVGAQALHIAAMHVPLLQDVLGLRPVSLGEWLAVLGLASIVVVIGEAYKFLRARPLERRAALVQGDAAAGA